MEPDAESGLFNISISDSEDGEDGTPGKAPRNSQSEAAFAEVKTAYRTKIENGEIWKNVRLPLGETVSKPEAQEIIHAVEEMYFFGRFIDALAFTQRVLRDQRAGCLDQDTKKILEIYQDKLARRVDKMT